MRERRDERWQSARHSAFQLARTVRSVARLELLSTVPRLMQQQFFAAQHCIRHYTGCERRERREKLHSLLAPQLPAAPRQYFSMFSERVRETESGTIGTFCESQRLLRPLMHVLYLLDKSDAARTLHSRSH